MRVRKFLTAGAAAALLAGANLVVSTTSASAYVVCNKAGDCWHTDTRYHYPSSVYVYHPDDWYFHQPWDSAHHWHDYHAGRGYWRNGVWVTF